MLSSKKSLPSRPEPPKWDSIHQDIESAADDDVAFSFFARPRDDDPADESALSLESQTSPEDEETEKHATGGGAGGASSGLRHRFGEVINSPTAIDVSSAISNVMAAASDALHKQKTPPTPNDTGSSSATAADDSLRVNGNAAPDDAEDPNAPLSAAKVDETYRKVLGFLEANEKLQVLLGTREEKKLFDQSFESVGDGRDEDFLDPVNDDDEEEDNDDLFKDDEDDSMAITSLGGLGGGDTIAECDHYLPRDKQDNFQDLVSKLDNLKQELSKELADLIEKTSIS